MKQIDSTVYLYMAELLPKSRKTLYNQLFKINDLRDSLLLKISIEQFTNSYFKFEFTISLFMC